MPKQPGIPDEQVTVTLGARDYEVVAQSLPYIKHHLGPVLSGLADESIDGSNVLDLITSKAYEILRVFIPDLMPEHEWNGLDEVGEYDDAIAQRAPTPPQIKTAVEVIAELNGFDLVKGVTKLVDPTLLREMIDGALRESMSLGSPTSSAPNIRRSASTTSSTTPDRAPLPPGVTRVPASA